MYFCIKRNNIYKYYSFLKNATNITYDAQLQGGQDQSPLHQI